MKTPIFKFILLPLSFFLFFNISSAQENFLSGYVVSTTGDTISGYIDIKDWKTNPKEITFKKELNQNPIIYDTSSIKYFNAQDNAYISAIVDIEISSRDIQNLKNDANLKLEKRDVFLKVLINGNKSLYYYKDEHNKTNFYIKENDKFILLTHKTYLKETINIVENNQYKGQLIFYLNDCKNIQSQINNATYTQESLTSVFEKYYKCIGSEIDFKSTKEKTALEFGIVAGITNTNLKFNNEKHSIYLNGDYASSTNLAAGLFLDIVFPKNNNKWSIHNELLYTSYSTKNTYIDYDTTDTYSSYNSEIGHTFIELNNLLRYTQPLGKLSVFLNGGISSGFVISDENYLKAERHNYSNVIITEAEATPNSSTFEFGFSLGTGITYQNIGLDIRYKFSKGVFSQFDSKINRLYVLLSYKI
ncbi:PorT family protein [Formosa sediminum]|uniref:PorT family protein n=1 Tax=Formosa sediminum TaxID=2594004 RepID=A0A516GN69_9FLAO|nr:outer membrane beta-barrel protein [Formosa sediminum]QDO92974.1 PorT family protein [Formosa sediminum]